MNVYCKCGKELEIFEDSNGRVDVFEHECTAKLAALSLVEVAARRVLAGASSSTGDGLFLVNGKLLDKLCEELNNLDGMK